MQTFTIQYNTHVSNNTNINNPGVTLLSRFKNVTVIFLPLLFIPTSNNNSVANKFC